jgi:flagellar biogenesis protein FliO
MISLRSNTEPSQPRRSLGQRLFARYGSAAILIVVLLLVIGWIGFLGWALMRFLSWL